ncbi:non-specific lipid-transfer protein 1-like [Mercurialis annua]|uniref:non-specific lipid-transfer protein 1-like n=1 Tax=Mercurialis annua TaxID=3986 RepID=UPI00215E81F2|nr:non-specific lipid-transfer protein 1-like [Mercurialis annua]
MANAKLVCVFMFCMVIAPMVTEAQTCNQIINSFGSCFSYITRQGFPYPSFDCCLAMRSISNCNHKAACNCLKGFIVSFRGIDFNLAESLPRLCGVNLPYKISPSASCDILSEEKMFNSLLALREE